MPSVVGMMAKGNFPAEGGEIPFEQMNTTDLLRGSTFRCNIKSYICVLKNYSAYIGVRVGTHN